MSDTVESLRVELAEARRELARATQDAGILKVGMLLQQKHGLDPDISPVLARSEEVQAKLREGQTPEHIAAGIAASAPAKFKARKPIDGKGMRERFQALHREAAERRVDAVAELRKKLGPAR